jgi:hypothetical protein
MRTSLNWQDRPAGSGASAASGSVGTVNIAKRSQVVAELQRLSLKNEANYNPSEPNLSHGKPISDRIA